MKKSILAIAVAASMAAPAAMAAPTVYGNVHLTILDLDSMNDGPDITSNTSSIGVKGSEDLGDGLKAIYKVEFQLDAADATGSGNALSQRDIFAGLKGGMGTIKLGIMSSNYKQTGSTVDSLYRTPAEGRGFIHTQSPQLHGGIGINRGRETNTLQYESPNFGGASVVVNTTMSNSPDETTGAGVRWSNKSISVYLDWIDGVHNSTTSTGTTESAMKIGGKFSADKFFIGAQYEDAEDMTDYNYTHINGGFLINANNIITATWGTAAHVNNGAMDTDGLAVAFVHNLSSSSTVYAAIVDKSSDTKAMDDNGWALGFRQKF